MTNDHKMDTDESTRKYDKRSPDGHESVNEKV